MSISICFTYFRSLALTNLQAALFSVRQQVLLQELVKEIVIIDNNTDDTKADIQTVIDDIEFPVPVRLYSFKHGDANKTHSWSTNVAVKYATAPWVLFSRADYLLDFDLLRRFAENFAAAGRSIGWNGFVTANVYHLHQDIGVCEQTLWRTQGTKVLRTLPGAEADYTIIDSGVWMSRRDAFHAVSGMDESLTAWGHAQTHFQHKLHKSGTEFVRIPEALFYHPQHSAPRDLALAHEQLAANGSALKEMWARYSGRSPY